MVVTRHQAAKAAESNTAKRKAKKDKAPFPLTCAKGLCFFATTSLEEYHAHEAKHDLKGKRIIFSCLTTKLDCYLAVGKCPAQLLLFFLLIYNNILYILSL